MKTYSSGEAARHLGVSLRTVQYYDNPTNCQSIL